jgi:hypothetical protein
LRCGPPALTTLPGRENFVLRGCGNGGLGDGEEFAADEPGDGRLCSALGDTDRFGEILVRDGDGIVGLILLLGREPEVDEEGGGAAVVTDEITHEDAGEIRIELDGLRGHGYTFR